MTSINRLLKTAQLLLRLETYPHRMNLHHGILELRKQHYKHLSKLLKTIALYTPTEIELKLGKSLRVTLLDANHCAGAVMFLIENDSKAILYTGDIRSEPWWINSLIRNPVVLPYTHGLKRLDKIYLDTTFASKKTQYRRFPTKADGLKELLEKVSKYPNDTIFHLHAWTFGYEDVWIALSSALRSQIHVDEYKYSLYKSLGSTAKKKNYCHEGSALSGFECGNKFQGGCLTPNQNVRLHSCQHDMGCSAMETSNVVYIRPVISRLAEGVVLREVGAGGGAVDLNQVHELDLNDAAAVENLIELCNRGIPDQKIRSNTIDFIRKARKNQKMVVSLHTLDLEKTNKTIPLTELAKLLSKFVNGDGEVSQINEIAEASCVDRAKAKAPEASPLRQRHPSIVVCAVQTQNTTHSDLLVQEFPYSRHSSYEELCDLVKAFEPVDVYPCTIDEGYIDLSVSIASLFGHLCFGSKFAHDKEMELLASRRETFQRDMHDHELQTMQSSGEESVDPLTCASNPESHALGDLERVPKRPPTSSSYLRSHKDDPSTRSPQTQLLSPKRKLPEFKESFRSYLGQRKREKISPTSKSTNPLSYCVGGDAGTSQDAIISHQRPSAAPHLKNELIANTLKIERLTNGPVDAHCGTQVEPIELSDSDPPSQSNVAGDFLLEEMPEPDDKSNTLNESRSDCETQVTLSDANFESQSLHDSNPDTKLMRLQQRKEAYKAAKEPNGIWGIDRRLISSNAHHGEEEVELW